MKYKKELGGLLIFLTFAWPVFDILDPSYTPNSSNFNCYICLSWNAFNTSFIQK